MKRQTSKIEMYKRCRLNDYKYLNKYDASERFLLHLLDLARHIISVDIILPRMCDNPQADKFTSMCGNVMSAISAIERGDFDNTFSDLYELYDTMLNMDKAEFRDKFSCEDVEKCIGELMAIKERFITKEKYFYE